MAERYEGFTDASGNQWVNYGTHACLAHQYDIDRLRVFVDCLRFLCRPAPKPIVTFREVGEGLAALCRPARLVTPREFGEMLTAMSEREYKSVSGRSERMFNGPEFLANVGSVLLPEKTTQEWLTEQARSIPGEPQNLYGDVSAPVNALELRLVERLDRHMLLLRNLGTPNFAKCEGDFRECGL